MAPSEIKKAAVLGSGVMGAAIAAHLSNVGIPAYLLDIVPRELLPDEAKRGLTLESPEVRNRLAIRGKGLLLKQKINPLYLKSNIDLITPGNFENDLDKLQECDWIIEAIVENMEIKKQLLKKVEAYRAPGVIVSSNTSGLSINEMVSECSAEFRRHFMGTHFFNPPRYMKLLELIPGSDTSKEVIDFMRHFCERILGKGVVMAKDTPNFIANRIGTYTMTCTIGLMRKEALTVEEVDAITGPPMGHPKSATFRTIDMVGLDTFRHVAGTCGEKAPAAEKSAIRELTAFLDRLVEKGKLGDKTGGGFYKKIRHKGGTEIHVLDYESLEYRPKQAVEFAVLKKAKNAGLGEGLKLLIDSDDRAGRFAWEFTKGLLLYAAALIPEIADDIVNVDRAMKWGFNWKMGPFETWDAIGVWESVARMKAEGESIPENIEKMLAGGCDRFYREDEKGTALYYDLLSGEYKPEPVSADLISLPVLKRQRHVIMKNDDASLIDLGDGVVCLEMHTMRQAITPVFTRFILEALEEAQNNFAGMVIGNQEGNFCVGANAGLVLMAAQSGDWEMLNSYVKEFQDTLMALKYAPIPVVAAPYGYTLGGGMEICLHCDRIQAAAETYMGLVESGIGLLPGGGGNKELMIRYIEGIPGSVNADLLPYVQKAFEAIIMARVATSAPEAGEMRFMRPMDRVTVNQDYLIRDAKQAVLAMLTEGYTPPQPSPIRVTGENGMAAFKVGVQSLRWGDFISDHDMKIAMEIAGVLCGGKIRPNSLVSEQYLLDIEREAFLRLCGEEKTHERITTLLKTGRPVRN